jgi:exosortase
LSSIAVQPAAAPRWERRALVVTLAWLGVLLLLHRGAVVGYLRDQHYQEHFVYLWAFLALALWRSLRPPFRARFSFALGRDRFGLLLAALAWLVYGSSQLVGSSTGLRTSLTMFVTAVAVIAVPAWTVKRCLMHGLLMLLCFGIPYNAYQPLTENLQWGVASVIALPAKLGLVDYTVEGSVVLFPDYELRITPECSGLGQLLTFLGIAALGVLASDRNRRRTLGLVLLAIVLAWLSNLARVAVSVFGVAIGWRWVVESPSWHAAIGFVVFMPFVIALIAVIVETHVRPVVHAVVAPGGRWPLWLLLAPLAALHLAFGRQEEVDWPAPAYFARITSPPGHELELRAPSEAADHDAYATPWLVNARFRDGNGDWFDLFHYATRSRSHLCVHKIAACLGEPDQHVRYEPAVVVDGVPWWRIALDRGSDEASAHVYFAFEVGGVRHDDSTATQLEVFRQRLLGEWEVRATRVTFPGPLPAEPGPRERRVLSWLGRLTAGG